MPSRSTWCALLLALICAPQPGPASGKPRPDPPRERSAADDRETALARGVLATLLAAEELTGAPSPCSNLLRTARALLLSDGLAAEVLELPPPASGCFLQARLLAASPAGPALLLVLPLPRPGEAGASASASGPRWSDPHLLVERSGQLAAAGVAGWRGLAAVVITTFKLLRREERTPVRDVGLLLVPEGEAELAAALHLAGEAGLRGEIVQLAGGAAAPAARTGSQGVPDAGAAGGQGVPDAGSTGSQPMSQPDAPGANGGAGEPAPGQARLTRILALPLWPASGEAEGASHLLPTATLVGSIRWLRDRLLVPTSTPPAPAGQAAAAPPVGQGAEVLGTKDAETAHRP